MSEHQRSLVVRNCEWCGEEFETPTKGKSTARFCSRSHAGKWRMAQPGAKEKVSGRAISKKKCEWCGETYEYYPPSRPTKFCSTGCSAEWRNQEFPHPSESDPNFGEKVSEALKEAHERNPEWAEEASRRMKENNPMYDSKVREKVSKSMKEYYNRNPEAIERLRQQGKDPVSQYMYGGNGSYTEPQLYIHDHTEWPMEEALGTSPLGGREETGWSKIVPDLLHKPASLAIEVDGRSHGTRKQKAIDRKKEELLKELGYHVIRIPNDCVDDSTVSWLKSLASGVKEGKSPNEYITSKPHQEITLLAVS